MDIEKMKEAVVRAAGEMMAMVDSVIDEYRKKAERPEFQEELSMVERVMVSQIISQQAFLIGMQEAQTKETGKPGKTAKALEDEIRALGSPPPQVPRPVPGSYYAFGAYRITIRKVENGFICEYPRKNEHGYGFDLVEVFAGTPGEMAAATETACRGLEAADEWLRNPPPSPYLTEEDVKDLGQPPPVAEGFEETTEI